VVDCSTHKRQQLEKFDHKLEKVKCDRHNSSDDVADSKYRRTSELSGHWSVCMQTHECKDVQLEIVVVVMKVFLLAAQVACKSVMIRNHIKQ